MSASWYDRAVSKAAAEHSPPSHFTGHQTEAQGHIHEFKVTQITWDLNPGPYRPVSLCWESRGGEAHTGQAGAIRGACPRSCTGDPQCRRTDPTPARCAAAAAPRVAASGPHARVCDPDRRPLQPLGAPRTPVPVPPAANIPSTPDTGAAGSPSGGGLLPRSPSRVTSPAPEAASAMARTRQVRGCETPGRRGAAGSWGPEWHHRARWRRDKGLSRPPAQSAFPALHLLVVPARAKPRFFFPALARHSQSLNPTRPPRLCFPSPPVFFSALPYRLPTWIFRACWGGHCEGASSILSPTASVYPIQNTDVTRGWNLSWVREEGPGWVTFPRTIPQVPQLECK